MRISDWSSDVCSSDLQTAAGGVAILGALDHVAGGGAQGEEGAVEIDRQHPAPFRCAEFMEGRPFLADASVGETAVDAPHGLQRRGEGVFDLGLVGDIDLLYQHAGAMGLQDRKSTRLNSSH